MGVVVAQSIWVNTQVEHSQTRQGKHALLVTVKKAQKPILVFMAVLLPFGVADFTITTQTRLVRLVKNKKLLKNPLTKSHLCDIIYM
jgi:hypothetical protein